MAIWQLIVLALIQGAAEMLPVSSSAHVIVAERLMSIDPEKPAATFLLVMLHTGTMVAVLIYFWPRWKRLIRQWPAIVAATACTVVVGLGLKKLIETVFLHGEKAEIEQLFGNLPLIAAALAAAGVLIAIAGWKEDLPEKDVPEKPDASNSLRAESGDRDIDLRRGAIIGIVQGLCLPFRGFSRSGATISTGMLLRIARLRAEEFSFALAVVLTPAVIGRELLRLIKEQNELPETARLDAWSLLTPGLLGMLFSFIAGLAALRLLTAWLEAGRWKYFGYYCLLAAAGVLAVHFLMPAATSS